MVMSLMPMPLCKGNNNDYFSTLELYAMHDGKSHGKMHPMSSVCFSQLLSAVGYDRIRFHGAQCVEIISEAKVFFMNISTIYFLYSFILTMNVPNVRTYKGMSTLKILIEVKSRMILKEREFLKFIRWIRVFFWHF